MMCEIAAKVVIQAKILHQRPILLNFCNNTQDCKIKCFAATGKRRLPPTGNHLQINCIEHCNL